MRIKILTSCSHQRVGLSIEEPGRYKDDSYFGKDECDQTSPLYTYDYWVEPKNSKKSEQERMTDTHKLKKLRNILHHNYFPENKSNDKMFTDKEAFKRFMDSREQFYQT